MAASNNTVELIFQVMKKYIDDKTFAAIMNDLKDVPGNKSFRDTIQRLSDKIESK